MAAVDRRGPMSERGLTAVLAYPAPLYVVGLVFLRLYRGGLGLPLGLLAALGFGTATAVGLLRHPIWVGAGRLLWLAGILGPATGIPRLGAAWFDLAAGLVMGAPFLLVGFLWREGLSPGVRLVALQTVLLAGAAFLATLTAPVPGGPAGPGFLDALSLVLLAQATGLATLLIGGTPVGMPLVGAFDSTFAALAGLATAGVMLPLLRPRTAGGRPLPWSWVRGAGPRLPAPGEFGLREGQLAALAGRTSPVPPESALPPGFRSLLAAAALLAGFLGLAALQPSEALLVLALGAAVALFVVGLVLRRRLSPLPGLAA